MHSSHPLTKYEQDMLLARVRAAIAEDPRTHVMDVDVVLERGGLVLSGNVQSEERRRSIEDVARELLPPSVPLTNCMIVVVYDEPAEEERLRT
jgi:hypothetical protein